MEGLQPVGKGRVPGYELLTCLLAEGQGRLGLGYACLLGCGERVMTSLPQEPLRAATHCHQLRSEGGPRLLHVADRGFNDCKPFSSLLSLGEGFVVRAYHDRRLHDGTRLRSVAEAMALPHRA